MNDLEMCAYLAQISLFCHRIPPMSHTLTRFNNTSMMGWPKHGSIRTATAVGPLL